VEEAYKVEAEIVLLLRENKILFIGRFKAPLKFPNCLS